MKFFIEHKYLSMLLLTIIIAVGIFAFINSQKKPESVTIKTKIDSIVVGQSSRDDVLKTLGTPIEEKDSLGFDLLTFGSSSPTRHDQVFLKENTAQLTKEIISYKDGRKATEIKNMYGIANYVLYGKDAGAGFYLFVYPDKGIAYLGNQNSDDLLEIWRFSPTDAKSFRKNYAPEYSDVPPTPIQ